MAMNLPIEVRREAERYAKEVGIMPVYVNLICEWLIYISGLVKKSRDISWSDALSVFPDIVGHPFFPVMESRFLDLCAVVARQHPVVKPSISNEFASLLLDMMATLHRNNTKLFNVNKRDCNLAQEVPSTL